MNADLRVLSSDFVPQLARIAEAFRPWGIRVSIAVDFSSPKPLGQLDTFDPLDQRVAAWWRAKADELYRAVPDLGGILLKADSEGRVGPSTYKRTHADAANVIARALKPHGGVLVYRGFVYNHHMDWRDVKNDRARAAYERSSTGNSTTMFWFRLSMARLIFRYANQCRPYSELCKRRIKHSNCR